jgi:hypothetical protein
MRVFKNMNLKKILISLISLIPFIGIVYFTFLDTFFLEEKKYKVLIIPFAYTLAFIYLILTFFVVNINMNDTLLFGFHIAFNIFIVFCFNIYSIICAILMQYILLDNIFKTYINKS